MLFKKARENSSPEQGWAPCQTRTIASVFIFLASIPHSQLLRHFTMLDSRLPFHLYFFHSNLCTIKDIVSEVKKQAAN